MADKAPGCAWESPNSQQPTLSLFHSLSVSSVQSKIPRVTTLGPGGSARNPRSPRPQEQRLTPWHSSRLGSAQTPVSLFLPCPNFLHLFLTVRVFALFFCPCPFFFLSFLVTLPLCILQSTSGSDVSPFILSFLSLYLEYIPPTLDWLSCSFSASLFWNITHSYPPTLALAVILLHYYS